MLFQFSHIHPSFRLLFLALPLLASPFATTRRLELTSVSIPRHRVVFLVSSEGYSGPDHEEVGREEDEEEDEEEEDDDDDEITVKAYRNRSLAWTLRYRKLNPYEQARARVINFGHRSKADWDEAVSSGQLG